MPRVFNISLANNFAQTFANFLLARYSKELLPRVIVILPSYSAASLLREAFLRRIAVMPKIIAMPGVDEEVVFIESGGMFKGFLDATEISEARCKFELVKICLETLQNFGIKSILAFVDDFLELENGMILLEKSIEELEEEIEKKFYAIGAKYLDSLGLFREIYAKWSALKRLENWCTRLEKNAYYKRCFLEVLKSKNTDIYAVGMAGISPEQSSFINRILMLEKGFFVCSGAENLCNEIKAPSCGILSEILGKFEIQDIGFGRRVSIEERVYANILEQVEQISCKIEHIYTEFLGVENQEKPSICVVSYNSKTGIFLADLLRKKGFLVEDSFGEPMAQNPYFRLFFGFIQQNCDLEFCIDFAKNSLILPEEKTHIYEAEKALRKNFESKFRGMFNFVKPEPEYRNFGEFLSLHLAEFRQFLAKNNDDFDAFMELARTEFGALRASDDIYLAILEDFAKAHRYANKTVAKPDVRVLSAIEARLFSFDYLFITDVNAGFLPGKGSKNRIITQHLQEAIGLKKCAYDVEWYDFTCLINAALRVFISYVRREFEGEILEPSNFLLHARLWAEIRTQNEVFIREDPIEKLKNLPNRPFKLESLPETIYVTQIATLMKNPYDFYVSRILGLEVLPSVKTELLPKDMGEIVHHAIFELFHRRGFREAIEMRLNSYNKGFLMDFYADSFLKLEAFFRREYQAFTASPPMKSYIEEKLECQPHGLPFKLACKPDRAEIYQTSAKIIDYKVKSVGIAEIDIALGLEPQLTLEAFIVNTLFPFVPLGNIECFYYYIDLKKGEVRREQIQIRDPKKSLELLFSGLTHYNYNEEAEYHKHRILARFEGI